MLRAGRHCTPWLALVAALLLLVTAAPAPAQRGETVAELKVRLREAQEVGSTPLEIATLRHRLGRVLIREGKFAEAETELVEALRIREGGLPADDPEIAATLTGLAVARNGLGRPSEAEKLFTRALEIRREAYGEGSVEVAAAYANLGALYVQMDRAGDAASYYDAAIERYERHGERSQTVIVSMAQRATLYEEAGDIAAADRMYERIVEMEEDAASGVALDRVAYARQVLAARYRERGDRKRAEDQYRQALEILGRLDSAAVVPYVAANLEGLGWAAREDGRLQEADQHYRRAIGLLEGSLGRDTPMLIPVLDGYSETLVALGRADDAAAFKRRSDRLSAAEKRRREEAKSRARKPPPLPPPAAEPVADPAADTAPAPEPGS